MKPSILYLNYTDFKAFTDEQRKLWNTPGSPIGIVMRPEHFEWLRAWEDFDQINPPDDEARKKMRYAHYRGWFDCLEMFDKLEQRP